MFFNVALRKTIATYTGTGPGFGVGSPVDATYYSNLGKGEGGWLHDTKTEYLKKRLCECCRVNFRGQYP